MENQSSLQAHLQKVHAPQNQQTVTHTSASPAPSSSVEHQPQDEAQDLSVTTSASVDASLSLVCPVECCPIKFNDSNTLAVHLQRSHSGEAVSRCPHCSYCLSNDQLAKDHWLTHHHEVCATCVYVFTSIYGPQLWKKVHVKRNSDDGSLNAIVTGLSRKRSAPSSINGSLSSESDHCESVSAESDHSDAERLCKRSRKQSCPKKVIAVTEEVTDEDCDETEDSDEQSNTKLIDQRRKKSRRCLKCPHRPIFSTYARLRIHKRNRHRSHRSITNLSTKIVESDNSYAQE